MEENDDTLIDPFPSGRISIEDSHQPTLTVLSGTDVGRVYPLEHGVSVVGRSPDVKVHIAHESISRRHCELTVRHDGQTLLRDLGSTNGTRVDQSNIERNAVKLDQGARIRLSKRVVLKFEFQDMLERAARADLYSHAVRDPLTGIHNKRFLSERLEHELAYAERHRSELCLLMFDLDHFKKINDSFGHESGDLVLVEVTRRVQQMLRAEDVFARYGGEEFVVMMRSTPLTEAVTVAERIRAVIAATPVEAETGPIPVTASIGVSAFDPNQPPSGQSLIAQADNRLYEAKELGRNRVSSP